MHAPKKKVKKNHKYYWHHRSLPKISKNPISNLGPIELNYMFLKSVSKNVQKYDLAKSRNATYLYTSRIHSVHYIPTYCILTKTGKLTVLKNYLGNYKRFFSYFKSILVQKFLWILWICRGYVLRPLGQTSHVVLQLAKLQWVFKSWKCIFPYWRTITWQTTSMWVGGKQVREVD
jgi:hypothetical protein